MACEISRSCNTGPIMRFGTAGLILAFVQAATLIGTALAQDPAPTPNQQISTWSDDLRKTEEALVKSQALDQTKIQALDGRLKEIIAGAEALKTETQKTLQPLQSELASLGPPPAEGQAPENTKVAQTRKQLTERLTEIEGYASQAQLIAVRAQNLLAILGAKEQGLKTATILQRLPTPLDPPVWNAAWDAFFQAAQDVSGAPEDWWQAMRSARIEYVNAVLAVCLLALSLTIAWPLHLLLRRRWGPDPAISEPTHARRVVAAGATAVSNILLPSLVLSGLWAVVWLISPGTDLFLFRLVQGFVTNLMVFLLVSGMAHATMAPRMPGWRVIPLTPKGARRVANRVTLLAVAAIFFNLVQLAATKSDMPPDAFVACISFLRNTVVALLLLSLLRPGYWHSNKSAASGFWKLVRILLAGIIVAIMLLSAAGYVYLAEFLLTVVVSTLVIGGGALLTRAALFETIGMLLRKDGAAPAQEDAEAVHQPFRLVFWARTLIDLILWLPCFYLLLIIYGLSPALLNIWIGRIMTGITIGQVTVSLGEVLLAIGVLVFGLISVNRAKQWLALRVLPQFDLDTGLQNSLAAGFGYGAGLVVLTLAILVLGIDLSNLAIVAGALSVGIGFGLKTIVENFVAGILILIERPIKVGDWISVGDHIGMVRRISVRSTEIITSDNASIILPNSELISGAVTNKTRLDKTFRVLIDVGVAYGSDTRLVRDLLLRCAHEHPFVCKDPEPAVIFLKFGDSALQFQLRCFTVLGEYEGNLGSDLHFAIDDVFRTNGIGIPFPQRDVHLHSGVAQSKP